MHSSGVICEFNPFHGGHAYLLSRMREQVGDDGCVICVMSGRFVQRGEAAMADPYLRAAMALAGGADLVVELPFPWSAGSAEHFATGGVRILTRLGVDTLTFGSESGDTALLSRAADALDTPVFRDAYASLCRSGMGTAAAYTEALRGTVTLPLPDGFPSSNDLLGIAYLSALHRVTEEGHTAPAPAVVTRVGARYRKDTLTDGEYPSATALRTLIREASCDPVALEAILEGTMPADALAVLMDGIRQGEAPLEGGRLMEFFHAFYRLRHPADCASFAEWGGGLASHICRHARTAASAKDFFDSLRTRQFTDARLRRALLFGVVGVTEEDLRAWPDHTTLLAANGRGRAFLKEWKQKNKDSGNSFVVVTKPADAPEGRQRELGEQADGLFTLCFPTPKSAGELLRRGPCLRP